MVMCMVMVGSSTESEIGAGKIRCWENSVLSKFGTELSRLRPEKFLNNRFQDDSFRDDVLVVSSIDSMPQKKISLGVCHPRLI
jgi:hypothetical protein